MKSLGLILLGILGGATPISVAQDAAPPSVDLYEGEKQPDVVPTPYPEPSGPNIPELPQLDEAFKPKSLGKEVDERRIHIQWRQLKNQVVNDPQVRAANAFAQTARTDLEKRKRLRNYYNIYYGRMSALASSPELKLALEAVKNAHVGLLDQPRVRPSPSASPASDAATVAALNLLKQAEGPSPAASPASDAAKVPAPDLPKQAERPSPSASLASDAARVAALNSPKQVATRPVNAASPQTQAKVDTTLAAKGSSLSTFLTAMSLPREATILKANAPVTVFAPTDDAFQKAPPGTIDVPLNADKIGKLLDYHIVKGAVTSNELTTRKAATINGASLDIKVTNGQITVNGAHVLKADLKVPVGVIYVIDKVLIPPQ
jgi:Secreted and surface protein containing fasciclin-like repeats